MTKATLKSADITSGKNLEEQASHFQIDFQSVIVEIKNVTTVALADKYVIVSHPFLRTTSSTVITKVKRFYTYLWNISLPSRRFS